MRVHARVPARLQPRNPGVREEEVRGGPRGARQEHMERRPLARGARARVVEEEIGDAIIIVVQDAERPFPYAWAEARRQGKLRKGGRGLEDAAALADGPVEQAFGARTAHQQADEHGARRLARDRDLLRIAAECADVALDPLQGRDLIE